MIKSLLINISKLIRGEIPTSKLVSLGLRVGKNFYRAGGGLIDPSAPYLIEIGDNVTFSRSVTVLAHDASLKESLGIIKLGKVNVGNNVFVGACAVILAGVTIGENSIIGAGSVVNKDIPANCVAVGNPAHVVQTLDEYIEKSKERMKNKPFYTKEYRFGKDAKDKEIAPQIKQEIKEDLEKQKYGYAEPK